MVVNELIEAARQVEKDIEKEYGREFKFHSLRPLFKQKDHNNNDPIAFISTANKTAGKTTFISLLSKKIYDMYGYKSMFICREGSEIDAYENTFADVIDLYHWDEIKTKNIITHKLVSLTEKEEFAYVAALKKASDLKKYSPLFKDVGIIILDEYQKEGGKYLNAEVDLLRILYRAVARGGGKMVRNVFILMTGNPVTLMNPYLINFNISKNYSYGKRYIKSRRAVAEFVINIEARKQMEESAASELFDAGLKYDCGVEFLFNDKLYLEKCVGKAVYLFTLIYDNKKYGVRKYLKNNIVHVGKKPDPSCQKILAFKANDRGHNVDLLEKRDFTWNIMREAYRLGKLRFDDLEAKQIIFDIMGIDLFG